MSDVDIAFKYGGISSEDYFLVRNIDRSILPKIENRLVHVPNGNRLYDFGSEYVAREFVIDVVWVGENFEDFRAKVRELADWLNPLTGEKELIFSDEPHLTYKAILDDSTDIDQIILTGKGQLTFVCTDLFARGQEQTQTISGLPRETEDVDTSTEWSNTIIDQNISVASDSIFLKREGENYNPTVDGFGDGTHDQTTNDTNDDLVLATIQTPNQDNHNINYLSGTFDGAIFDPFDNKLIMNNLPNYQSNVLDYMDNVDTVNDWELYTDPTDPGAVTFTQNLGHYTMEAIDMDGAIRRLSGNFSFPITVDFLYRLGPSDPNESNLVRVDARVVFGGRLFAAQLGDTNDDWKMCRIVVHDNSQADFYIDGVREGSLTPFSTSLTDRVQFFTDQAWQAKFDLGYFGMVNEPRTAYQQNSYPYPTISTYVSPVIDLDNNSDIYVDSEISFQVETGTIFEDFESDVVVQADVYKNGVWKGYQTVNDGDPLPHLSPNDDLTGVQARIRVVLSAYGRDEEYTTPNITPITLTVDGLIEEYVPSGSYVSDIDTGIQQVGKASQTTITWDDYVPPGTNVTCSVSFDNGTTYQPVTKGDPLPGVTPQTDLSSGGLKVKFELETNDPTVTPKVFNYGYSFTSAFVDSGERVGAEYLDLSRLESIGESYIGWDTTPNATQDVEVYVNITDQPTPTGPWVRVTDNPTTIPGITPGDTTLLDKKVFCRQVLKSPTKLSSPILNRLLFWVEEEGGGQIAYNGTADSYPIITINFLEDINGDVQPFSIVHVQTGNQLLFNGNFAAGVDVMEIDCVKGSVKLNGVHAMNRLAIQSDFFRFIKGNNDFVITPENSASVEFTWRERFL